jgi:hypothetical protein
MHLLVMFLLPTTCLYENKRLGPFDLTRVHAFALSMLGCEVVRVAIKVLECGENLGEVAFGRSEHWEDVVE